MPHQDAPPEITALADARAAARRARDWATADRLKAELEAAGWRVVDTGTLYDLERAAPPDVTEDGVTLHGSSATVPSRLDEAPVGTATVVLVATDRLADVARVVRGLVDHAPDGTQLVVVANAPSDQHAEALGRLDAVDPGAPGLATEVVRTAVRLGPGAALNAGIRRATAAVVVLLDPSVEPVGDVVTPLVAALHDSSVAVAGESGLVTADLRRFEAAPAGAVDVAAISGGLVAFRRADYAARGPLDEGFALRTGLDAWWSLVLREPWSGDDDAADPRRAVQVAGLPVISHESRPDPDMAPTALDRVARRDRYRLLKRFATRRDLVVGRGS